MKEHRCIRKTDRKLAKTNTRLVRNLLNPNHIFVATQRIKNYRDGKKATSVVAAYCPFCGEKLEGA